MPPKTVEEYLNQLPPDRRAHIESVRKVILANLDSDYAEGIQYGMIGYFVPHSVHPAGYHCNPKEPLPFAALGSKKDYMSLHLMCLYGDTEHTKWFQDAWTKTGKKLDMGKACIRFKRADDLALEVIGQAIKRVPAKKYIQHIESALAQSKAQRATAKPKPKKTVKKPVKKHK